MQMLCRNRVSDFERWKAVFDSDTAAHSNTGLTLVYLWRAVDDDQTIFFIFDVSDKEKATAFVNSTDSADTGREAGVLDGEYHFVEDVT